jgi:anhydro-N-acetylmuramic acid kinase
MASRERYKVIGMMSGTSLDGLDIALCSYERKEKGWHFSIDTAKTIRYSKQWLSRLASAHLQTGEQLIETDVAYGKYMGQCAADVISKARVRVDFIASHGHTVFHQPRKGFTCQIGNGQAIHAVTGLPVVYDFRSLDVMLGGEGAPLVPVGDKHLFHEYDVCVNLGGIANLSMDVNKQRKAFDICFNNMGLNYLSAMKGLEYDKGGELASQGAVNKKLLKKLDALYSKLRNKRPSLGRELFEKSIKPLLDEESIPVEDKLATMTESAAKEIVAAVPLSKKDQKVLCTGGGAFNSFFISRLLDLSQDRFTLIVPDEEIIKFKEALVFGFLGVLRVRDEVNCLQSVTNASRSSSSGVLVGF